MRVFVLYCHKTVNDHVLQDVKHYIKNILWLPVDFQSFYILFFNACIPAWRFLDYFWSQSLCGQTTLARHPVGFTAICKMKNFTNQIRDYEMTWWHSYCSFYQQLLTCKIFFSIIPLLVRAVIFDFMFTLCILFFAFSYCFSFYSTFSVPQVDGTLLSNSYDHVCFRFSQCHAHVCSLFWRSLVTLLCLIVLKLSCSNCPVGSISSTYLLCLMCAVSLYYILPGVCKFCCM